LAVSTAPGCSPLSSFGSASVRFDEPVLKHLDQVSWRSPERESCTIERLEPNVEALRFAIDSEAELTLGEHGLQAEGAIQEVRYPGVRGARGQGPGRVEDDGH